MLESRISRLLLILGAGVGVVGTLVWALELQINLPDWMIRIAMLKLAFIASAGLLAAGALVGRHAKSARRLPSVIDAPAQLGEGSAQPIEQSEERSPTEVKLRRKDTSS